jgi:hypothetical protein
MTATTLTTLLLLGGVCHFGILLASALVPRVLDWKGELKHLSPLSRHLVWTHGAFIVLTIVAFGAISVTNAPALADGSKLSRCVAGFIGAFWLARLGIQLFLFDARPFLTGLFLKLGYHGLTVVFAYLGVVYAWAAMAPPAVKGGAL